MNFRAFFGAGSDKIYTLPILVLYVTEACNLQCIMCSYRDRLPNELSLEEISALAEELQALGLKRIVYSGGEPLLRRDFPLICRIFRRDSIKQTLLTNGILLRSRTHDIANELDDIIVSLDGASPKTHNEIRGVDSFSRIVESILLVKQVDPSIKLSIRTVVQRKNFREIPDLINLCLSLAVDRISFLAVDVLSQAFGRTKARADNSADLVLNQDEVTELCNIINKLAAERSELFESGFISESPERLMQIASYFEALTNGKNFPVVPCNAPMISAVITSTGEFLPCFFLPSVGNIREHSVRDLLNSKPMQSTRSAVRSYSLERCQTCVCRLKVSWYSALVNAF